MSSTSGNEDQLYPMTSLLLALSHGYSHSPEQLMSDIIALQKKLSPIESFRRRFFTKSNLSMGIGWLVFLLLVFYASKHGGSETPFFDPYEILQVGVMLQECPLCPLLALLPCPDDV